MTTGSFAIGGLYFVSLFEIVCLRVGVNIRELA